MIQGPPPIHNIGTIGEDDLTFHVSSSSLILPTPEDIGEIKNFGGDEEYGDGEGAAEAREVQEVAPRKPSRTSKSKPPSKAAGSLTLLRHGIR